MNDRTYILRIKSVHLLLGALSERCAFIGGSAVSIYAQRPVRDLRPTEDVDIIVELLTYSEETVLDKELIALGFKNDITAKHRYAYVHPSLGEVTVDAVPVNSEVAGFSNAWYPEGMQNAEYYTIDDHATVKIFTAPYFVATKLEAFKDRGKDEPRLSRDLEDIVFILENRRTIWDEFKATSGTLREYLIEEFSTLLANKNFAEWIRCHIDPMGSPPADFFIIPRLEEFVKDTKE